MEKVYTPLEYSQGLVGGIKPGVKPTVGKFLGGTLEDVLAASIPITGGAPQIARNVLREGLNIPAALSGAAVTSGLYSGIKKLKGEQLTPEELATAGLLGVDDKVHERGARISMVV